ncbi:MULTISPECIES: hypothetical protein [Aquimarina]|uniref:hypothetical protein n=1 Tax=Aquimarina TaxID=290174 RepID=UPI000AFCB703|nr:MULTISPECIES: hypothetical protein [Aquimarina]
MKKSILNLGKAISKKGQKEIKGGMRHSLKLADPFECEECTDGHLCDYENGLPVCV